MSTPSEPNRKKAYANQLVAASKAREHELGLPGLDSDAPSNTSSDNNDIDAPIVTDIYLAQGNKGLVTMTNFTLAKFDKLWELVKDYILANWNVGWGKKASLQQRMSS